MAGMVDSYEVAVLDYMTAGAGTTVSPTNWFVILYTAAPLEDGTGGTEVSTAGTAYARVSMANTDWAAAVAGQPSTVSNSNTVTFPVATASWGNVVAFGIAPAGVEGVADVQDWALLDISKTIGIGDTASFAPGTLTLQLGDPTDTY